MDISHLIAGMVGPIFAAIGIAMLFNRDNFPSMITQVSQDQGLIFVSGILSLLGGIAIVRAHNIWTNDWQVVVTLVGWLAIVGGLLRMWAPQQAAPIAQSFAGNTAALIVGGVLVLSLGAFLSYKAYR